MSLPPAVVAAMHRATADPIASGQADRALRAGRPAPAFTPDDLLAICEGFGTDLEQFDGDASSTLPKPALRDRTRQRDRLCRSQYRLHPQAGPKRVGAGPELPRMQVRRKPLKAAHHALALEKRPVIKLYYHHTPNPAKVALMREETSLPYEVVGVDTFKGEQHGAAYRATNPNGKVPALVDDGVTVFDSNAILLFLAEKTNKFLGTNEERPQVLSWLMFTASGIGPYSGQAFHFTRVHSDSAYATNRYLREVERHYSVMDSRLAASTFLAGRDYTIADIAAWGWLDWAARNQFVFTDADAPQRWPNLRRWLTGINARPAVERARKAGADLKLKTEFDEETLRAMFPQNFATAL